MLGGGLKLAKKKFAEKLNIIMTRLLSTDLFDCLKRCKYFCE